MAQEKDDPVASLAKGLAADHTLAKARAEGGTATETENEADMSTEPAEEPDAPDRKVVGDFESFDEVRKWAADSGETIEPGDLAIVNGGLVRATRKGFDIVLSSIVDEYELTGTHSDAHEAEMQKLARIVENAEFESGRLLDDVRDLLLMLYKGQRVLWSGRSQAEQRDFAKQVEAQSKGIIRKIARVVAEGEEISVAGKLERYSHSGSFDLKITAASDEEAALQLFRMQGHDVVILSADSARFIESSSEAETDPDEPDMFADPEEPEVEEEQPEPPADDSDLADGDDEPDAVTKATASNDDGVGEYESRSNPDDEPDAEFEEASEEELAQQEGRGENTAGDDAPKADYVGAKEPEDAVPGESWIKPGHNDDRPRYKNPNGKWYLTAPTAEALDEWRQSQASEASDGFPDDPA